jgi:hypothetical protein
MTHSGLASDGAKGKIIPVIPHNSGTQGHAFCFYTNNAEIHPVRIQSIDRVSRAAQIRASCLHALKSAESKEKRPRRG